MLHELLALKWENIDFEKGILNIKFNLQRLPNGGGLVLDKPKTKTSIWSIKSGQDTIDVHKAQKKRIAREREAKSEIWQDEGFVFPSTVGSAKDPSNMLRYFRA